VQELQIEATDTVREAKLKPEGAERYPTLPVRMWTSATWLAELVASYRGAAPAGPEGERPLPDTDFEFRGGSSAGSAACLRQRALMGPPLGL
jgi:hypothetical protein